METRTATQTIAAHDANLFIVFSLLLSGRSQLLPESWEGVPHWAELGLHAVRWFAIADTKAYLLRINSEACTAQWRLQNNRRTYMNELRLSLKEKMPNAWQDQIFLRWKDAR
jgi:hypothetical protein